jgi:hypothetical protein
MRQAIASEVITLTNFLNSINSTLLLSIIVLSFSPWLIIKFIRDVNCWGKNPGLVLRTWESDLASGLRRLCSGPDHSLLTPLSRLSELPELPELPEGCPELAREESLPAPWTSVLHPVLLSPTFQQRLLPKLSHPIFSPAWWIQPR